MQGMTFFNWQIFLTFQDLGDRSGRAIGFPFFPLILTQPHLDLLNKYLRARHEFRTRDTGIGKTEVVLLSRSWLRRRVMAECHEGEV